MDLRFGVFVILEQEGVLFWLGSWLRVTEIVRFCQNAPK